MFACFLNPEVSGIKQNESGNGKAEKRNCNKYGSDYKELSEYDISGYQKGCY